MATLNSTEAADRLAIRTLIDAYAHCADRCDATGQKGLFTADTTFVVYMDGPDTAATQELHGREALTPIFENLRTYARTTHFNGQSTVVLGRAAVEGEEVKEAAGESYCLAHHVYDKEGTRMIMIASIRYLDRFAKVEGTWLFGERRLYVDWVERRPCLL